MGTPPIISITRNCCPLNPAHHKNNIRFHISDAKKKSQNLIWQQIGNFFPQVNKNVMPILDCDFGFKFIRQRTGNFGGFKFTNVKRKRQIQMSNLNVNNKRHFYFSHDSISFESCWALRHPIIQVHMIQYRLNHAGLQI